ncbi:hypothetical protein TSACC_2828 [Terrimicrobium sacchariphilum]|uniref:Tetratricopeptide repeat-containing protein n=1 Tax=Terrimicrobium sacchariphilum TaxID=690879 RepID=A0A146G469_TERSA|nr:hypothetical protein [Terrimicrobium sacchariphilum]GAT32430.1 hypothetical protein TSACC_2828 [Terrimicrobium sacchariphilum]
MKALFPWALVAALAVSAVPVARAADEKTTDAAATETTDDLVSQLDAAVRAAVKEQQKDAGTGAAADRSREMQYYVTQAAATVRRALSSGGGVSNLQDALNQVQAVAPSENVQKLCAKILATAQAQAEARDKAVIDQTTAQVDAAMKTTFAAKTPKDLDDAIIQLSNLSLGRNYNSSEAVQRKVEQARAAVTFMCRWQDYLANKNNENIDAARTVLQKLAQDTSSYPFVPRSEILQRIDELGVDKSRVGDPLPSLQGKKLADLDALYRQTAELKDKNMSNPQIEGRLRALRQVIDAKQQAEAGLYGQAFSYCTNRYAGQEGQDVLPLTLELLMTFLPKYLEIEAAYPAKADDTPVVYLQRVNDASRAKGDWKTTARVLEAYRQVAFANGQTPNWITGDSQAITAFIQGQNYESAGMYREAIQAYKRVISQTGDNIPIEQTKARLEAIRKEHPQDAEAAEKAPEVRPYPVSVPYPVGR